MASTSDGRRTKFEFADGLRAVAAMLVALLHATTFTGHLGDVDEAMPIIARLMEIGNYAVPVFIVLSGYVLTLPIARSDNFELRGGFWRYVQRRARRILPPYYASLALFLTLIVLVPVLQDGDGTAWENKVPVTADGLISHILLVHNWNPEWIYQINGPAWSVATEWHIYFLLPLVLLPLCRRFGPWAMLAIAIILGPAVTIAFPSTGAGSYWFIGLFAMGMMAAIFTVRGRHTVSRWLGWAAVIIFSAAAAWQFFAMPTSRSDQIASDTLAGLAVACGLVALGRASIEGRRSVGLRLFEWRPLVKLGLWSYSVYLVHSPLLALVNFSVLPFNWPTALHWCFMVGVATPLAFAAAYLFFHLVERHFTTSHQKIATRKAASEVASGDPSADLRAESRQRAAD